jgi:putative Mg2+ transporter-C (MgtC) family protein
MMGVCSEMEMIVRLLMASVLGAAIGFEREVHGRPAGFRTHLLVSLGSALFVLTSIAFYQTFGNFNGTGPVGVDPGRVAAQVVTGIGFLGAGAIIRERASIRGLTTAACLWVVAAIGVACGIGLFSMALVVTLLALLSLLLLKKLENMLRRDSYTRLVVWSEDREGQISLLEEHLSACAMQVLDLSMERDKGARTLLVEFNIRYRSRKTPCNLIDSIMNIDGVVRVRLD